MTKSEQIKELRKSTGLSQAKFAALFTIPAINIAHWETDYAHPPDYVIYMMRELLKSRGYQLEDRSD